MRLWISLMQAKPGHIMASWSENTGGGGGVQGLEGKVCQPAWYNGQEQAYLEGSGCTGPATAACPSLLSNHCIISVTLMSAPLPF